MNIARAIARLRLLGPTLIFCVSLVGVALPAWADVGTSYTYQVLFDTDNNPATGCNVPVDDGTLSTTFLGAERLVALTVERTGTGGTVTGITVQSCVDGTFGAAQPVSPGGWPVGKGNGVGGGDVIEGFVPAAALSMGGPARVAFTASPAATPGSDVMLSTPDGSPIVFDVPVNGVPVPALSTAGLALCVLLLGGVALWALRRRRRAHQAALLALALTAGVATATPLIVMDGQVGDWGALPPVATDPAYDNSNPSPAEDLVAGFLTTDGTRVYFRVDVYNMCDSCTFAFSRTVNQIGHMTGSITFDKGCTSTDPYGSNNCTMQVGGKVTASFQGALQADILTGKLIVNLRLTDTTHSMTPFQFSCPICGGDCTIVNPFSAASETFAMPACPILAVTIDPTKTLFPVPGSPRQAVPAFVPSALRSAIERVFGELSVPASITGTVQITNQTSSTIILSTIAAEWQQP